jgi:hypothetical protein
VHGGSGHPRRPYLGAVDPKEATMPITIDRAERAVLYEALREDVPSIADVLRAYEDVDQVRAEAPRWRLMRELTLLDRLGWQAEPQEESFELGTEDLLALHQLYRRSYLSLHHLVALEDDQPSRVLAVCGKVLSTVAVFNSPEAQRLMEDDPELRAQIEASLIAIKAKDARVIQRQVAQMELVADDLGGHERDARELIARLRPVPARLRPPENADGGYVLSASPGLIARTFAWLIFDACATLSVEMRTAAPRSRSAEHALATYTLCTTLFDRFVQDSLATSDEVRAELSETDAS